MAAKHEAPPGHHANAADHHLPPALPAGSVSVAPTPSHVPTRVLFGDGCAGRLSAVVAGAYRPREGALLVVTGRRATKPWLAGLLGNLEPFGPVVVESIRPNPTVGSVQRLLDRARSERPAVVVAIGGGSVLDSAKTVALLARAGAGVREALREPPADPQSIPLVAVPTTAGTGAEVTRTATLWDDTRPRKHALDHAGLFPDTALVDPSLVASVPAPVRASTALDALSQAVESAWSVRSTGESLAYSLQATALAAGSIEAACLEPDAGDARARLSLASLYAGMAIARARTTLAHAISYPLTARYGLPHGYACGLTLGALVRFNAATTDGDCDDPRGAAHVRDVVARVQQALGVTGADAAERRVERFVAALGLPPLAAHARVDLATVAADVASYDRSGNNPRRLDRAGVLRFLQAAAGRPAA